MKEKAIANSGRQRHIHYEVPQVKIITVVVENGYASSIALGGDGNSVSTGGDYSWNDEINF